MKTRAATNTIKGYLYQFDYSIYKILLAKNNTDEITIEGTEDVDLKSIGETRAIQCKYYENTEFNISIIAKPIRLMLRHFKEIINRKEKPIKYMLYGYYKNGHSKLSLPISLTFLKNKLLTYEKNKIKYEEHKSLNLSDSELKMFIDNLVINIHADEYNCQRSKIIKELSILFSCDDLESEYYYYTNAINVIQKLSISSNINDRMISKEDFLRQIDKKQIIFNKWLIQEKGENEYFKRIKENFFTQLNQTPSERFFVLDINENTRIREIIPVLIYIANKYSNIKKKENHTYCPYVYLNNISKPMLSNLLKQIYNDIKFIDGFPFRNSDFNFAYISTQANYNNKIKLKFIYDRKQFNTCIKNINKYKEIYQFFFKKSIIDFSKKEIRNIDIQINKIENIKKII